MSTFEMRSMIRVAIVIVHLVQIKCHVFTFLFYLETYITFICSSLLVYHQFQISKFLSANRRYGNVTQLCQVVPEQYDINSIKSQLKN